MVHFTIGALLIILINASSCAQKRLTISGTFKDALTGKMLIGATVRIKGAYAFLKMHDLFLAGGENCWIYLLVSLLYDLIAVVTGYGNFSRVIP